MLESAGRQIARIRRHGKRFILTQQQIADQEIEHRGFLIRCALPQHLG
jgi:hypothetical protein